MPSYPISSILSRPIPLSHPISPHHIPSHPIPTHPSHHIPSHHIPSHHIYPIPPHPTPCHATPPLTRLTSRSAGRRCGRGSAGSCPSGGRSPQRARCTGRAGRQGSPSGRAGTGHTAGPRRRAGTGTARSPRRTAATPSPPGSKSRLRDGTAQVRHVGAGTQGQTDRQMGDQHPGHVQPTGYSVGGLMWMHRWADGQADGQMRE